MTLKKSPADEVTPELRTDTELLELDRLVLKHYAAHGQQIYNAITVARDEMLKEKVGAPQ